MPVNVIGTLKPKNNGKFPVAEAVDIKVTEDLRLDKALENKADLTTLNFALGGKADKSDINGLQSQINEIITPVTQDAEVQNARVGTTGISYDTLKQRLDTEATQSKKSISDESYSTSKEFDAIREKVVGKNLIDGGETESGYLNPDGTIHANSVSSDWITTGFIRIHDDNRIVASRDVNGERTSCGIFYITEYDEKKNLLRQATTPEVSNKFTFQSDCAYFRLCYHGENTRVMIEFGTAYSTTYEDYEANYHIYDNAISPTIVNAASVVNNNISYIYDYLDAEIESHKLINKNGEISNYDVDGYAVAIVDVEGNTRYAITASANFKNLLYVIYDENDNIIATSGAADSGSTIRSIVNELVVMPTDAASIAIANIASADRPEPAIATTDEGLIANDITEELENKIKGVSEKKWTTKKWVCVGDSLTESNSRTTKNYHDYVSEYTGITVINKGEGGSGYKKKEENNKAFYQRVDDIPLDADVITIFGSGNDLTYVPDALGTITDTGTTTLCGCINTTIDSIIARIPAASLGIVAPTPWIGQQPTVDDSNSMAQYSETLRQICKIRSIPFLDLYHCSNLRPWTEEGRTACYSRDDGNGVHPDENGHKLIAPRFMTFLESLIM